MVYRRGVVAAGRIPLAVWVVLLIATGLTYAAGEYGLAAWPTRPLIAGVLVLAFIKGALVSLDFMELRHAPALWRRLVLGWLLVIVGGILLIYLKGTS